MSTWDISIKYKLNNKAICIKTSIQTYHNKKSETLNDVPDFNSNNYSSVH